MLFHKFLTHRLIAVLRRAPFSYDQEVFMLIGIFFFFFSEKFDYRHFKTNA